MTLVACFPFEGHPFLVGDIMLSRQDDGHNKLPFDIPTRTNVNAIASPNTGYIVAGLAQKIAQLSGRLMVAWAGNASSAQKVTQDLRGEENHATFEMIENKLKHWEGEAGFKHLYLTGLYVPECNAGLTKVLSFDWDSKKGWHSNHAYVSGYGDCFFGGSGGDTFQKVLSTVSNFRSSGGSKFEKGLLLSLSHLAMIMGEQMRLGFGVMDRFGGAFECASFINGQLQKASDISYHFWDARPDGSDGVKIGMRATLKIGYFEDYLLIRKLKFSTQNTIPIIKNELYVIRPPYRTVTDNEKRRLAAVVDWPGLSSRFSVFYVHIPMTESRQGRVCTFVNKSPEGTSAVEYETDETGITMEIAPEVFRSIHARVHTRNPDR